MEDFQKVSRSAGGGSGCQTNSKDKEAGEDLDSVALEETEQEEIGGGESYDLACAEVDRVWDAIVEVFKKSGRFSEAERRLTMSGHVLRLSRWKRYRAITDLMRYSIVYSETFLLNARAVNLREKQLIQSDRLSVFGAIQQFEMEKFGMETPLPTSDIETRKNMWIDYLNGKAAEGTYLRAVLSRLLEGDMEMAATVISQVVERTERQMKNKPVEFPPNISASYRRVTNEEQPCIIAIYPQILDVAEAWIACAILKDMHALWVYGNLSGPGAGDRIWGDEEGQSILEELNPRELSIVLYDDMKYERRPNMEKLEFINLDRVDWMRDFVRDYFPEEVCEQELDPLLNKLEDALLGENRAFLEWMEPARENFSILTTLHKKYAEDVSKLETLVKPEQPEELDEQGWDFGED